MTKSRPQAEKTRKRAKGYELRVAATQTKETALQEIKTMKKVQRIMSKYLLSQLSPTIKSRESWLVQTLRRLQNTQPPELLCCQVRFENIHKAVETNSALLQECKYDFNILTKEEHNKVIMPGLEFWDMSALKEV